MSDFAISKIRVPELLCPLIETKDGARITHFGNGTFTIWSPPIASTLAVSVPVIISKEQATLNVSLQGNIPANTPVLLTATYSLPGSHTSHTLVSYEFKWDPDNLFKTVPILAPTNVDQSSRPVPWAFRGTMTWQIKAIARANTVMGSQTTDLEIYVLPEEVPRFAMDNGLPLALLRLDSMFPTWMRLSESHDKDWPLEVQNDWPKFVTYSLFRDKRMCYDTFLGSSVYSTFNSTTDIPEAKRLIPTSKAKPVSSGDVSCWMDLWLSDMNGLDEGKKKVFNSYPVNCNDTAAVVHAIASLGTGGSTGAARWRMVYQEPYGFIKRTHLIGRYSGAEYDWDKDWCNNPYYKDTLKVNPEMECSPTAMNRSYVQKHVYLVLGDEEGPEARVYDACFGPHLGDQTWKSYLSLEEGPIDSKRPFRLVYGTDPPKASPFPNPTEYDCKISNGVVNLASASSFVRNEPKISPSPPTLFGKMTDILSGHGDLAYPFEGSMVANDTIVATWTFIPKKAPETACQISISRYRDEQSASKAFEKRRSDVPPESRGDDAKGDLSCASETDVLFRMFVVVRPKYSFLVVVEGNMNKEVAETEVVVPVRDGVLSQDLIGQTAISDVNLVTDQNPTVDNRFEVKLTVSPPIEVFQLKYQDTDVVQPDPKTKDWWRGYKVDSEKGVSRIKATSWHTCSSIGTDDS